MPLGCTNYPQIPTMYFEYKRYFPGMQGFFCDRNPGKTAHFSPFCVKTRLLKQMFDPRFSSLRKIKSNTRHNILCRVLLFINFPTKSCFFRTSFLKAFVIFYKFFVLRSTGPSHSSWAEESRSFLPSSLSRCSCILAAEAVRKRTRDCFTSSNAAWTASSVRARASSAYSLATW